MASRKHPSPMATALKLGELSVAAPQVVAHRVSRMALGGPFYSKRDQTEFMGMVQEKQLAFAQSWWAMMTEGVKVQQQWWLMWSRSMMAPTGFTWPALRPMPAQQMAAGWLRVAGKGLAPVHAKAVANSKRLARTRLR